MSAYYSIKKDGYPTPPGMAEIHDFFRTTQPAEYLDRPADMDAFAKIYGDPLAAMSIRNRRVPENVSETWVLPGIHYRIGEDPVLPGIPAPGEPTWVKRLEAKLDALLARK